MTLTNDVAVPIPVANLTSADVTLDTHGRDRSFNREFYFYLFPCFPCALVTLEENQTAECGLSTLRDSLCVRQGLSEERPWGRGRLEVGGGGD